MKDKYASKEDIAIKERSVLSNKTLEEVAENPDREWKSHREQKTKKQTEPNIEDEGKSEIDDLIKKGKKAPFPSGIEPMLCTLIKEPFNNENFLYEVKLDGYRVIAYVKKKKATLSSRSGLDYSKYYKPVVDELSSFDVDVVLDGEVVALNEKGIPDFDALQKNDGTKPLAFYAFDILWYNGYNLMDLNLEERKTILAQVLPQNDIIKFSENFDDGLQLFGLMKKNEMEGIVAKNRESKYQPGKRGKDWLKIPTEKRQEFVIGGWTESETGSAFRLLLFGAYENGKLKFIGNAGGGFKENDKPVIKAKLKKLEIKASPFVNKVETKTEVHWVNPELVANIKFATYTTSGTIRKPAIFLGFREDKDPKDVVIELPLSHAQENKIIKDTEDIKSPKKIKERNVDAEEQEDQQETFDSKWKDLETQETTSKDSITIDGNEVEFTNIENELWKGVTKADLITYYNSVTNYILPYLADRAESLYISSKAMAPGTFIKDMEGRQPQWAQVFSTARKHKKEGKRDVIDYLVCQNRATLIYMINLGCIEIYPWTSRITNYQQPDFIIIDLDPSDDDFSKAIKTALAAKQLFDKLKLKAFPKTSGKTGLHIYLPCEGFTFSEARTIAVNISNQITELVPDIATSENTIAHREDKIFVDYNQNDEADTVAAPYSVRATRHPTVSTPLEWKEINDKLHPSKFDMHNILDRIKKKGDLFKGALDEKIRKSNSKILKGLLNLQI